MGERPANAEMVQGYMDGLDPDAPEPSDNRSHSYRHGFANGRDDRRGQPRDTYAAIVAQAEAAMDADAEATRSNLVDRLTTAKYPERA